MKKKKVKGWAITTLRGKIIASNMEFPPGNPGGAGRTVYPAIYLRKEFASRRKSWFAHQKGTKIVPITITYEI